MTTGSTQHTRTHETARRPSVRAFTLIDVLVSIAVIGVLISLMLPSIAMVQESARRIACSSDMRQFGLGLGMYAEDNDAELLPSVYLTDTGARTAQAYAPHLMDTVRTSPADHDERPWGHWDGLGVLHAQNYITAPGVFYCPSHRGMSRAQDLIPRWRQPAKDPLIANYQYRGVGPDGQRFIHQIDPDDALVTDSVRSIDELNHDDGFNVLAAGLSVRWFHDDGQVISSIMGRSGDEDEGQSSTQAVADVVEREWAFFDGDAPGSDD